MNLIKCPYNHIYNADHYPSCPDCANLKISDSETSIADQHDIITDTVERAVTDIEISADSYLAGWLVCIEGPDYGSSYPLHSGTNAIGRGANMDVHISKDLKVSRYIHATVIYDNNSVSYSLQVRNGVNAVWVNDSPIIADNEDAVVLHDRDRIRIGNTTFIFIALCGDDFSWK